MVSMGDLTKTFGGGTAGDVFGGIFYPFAKIGEGAETIGGKLFRIGDNGLNLLEGLTDNPLLMFALVIGGLILLNKI